MDFIFDLPKKKDGKTAIFVVVDKLLKRTHLIPLGTDNNAKILLMLSTEKYTNITASPEALPRIEIHDLRDHSGKSS